MSLKEAITGGGSETLIINGQPKHYMGYLRDFLFSPEQAGTAVGKLSGGERGRLVLARALALPSNLLVLDEPTNDLDLETLDLLEEMLADYPGTVIVVSHDRDFLDRVATSVLIAEGDGHWTEYPGGYSDMVTQRGYGVLPPGAKAQARIVKAAAAAKSTPDAAPKKLSFKHKHALETLPVRMAGLEKEMKALTAEMADPALYSKNPKRFAAASARLDAAQAELIAAEDEWLTLEALRESLGG